MLSRPIQTQIRTPQIVLTLFSLSGLNLLLSAIVFAPRLTICELSVLRRLAARVTVE